MLGRFGGKSSLRVISQLNRATPAAFAGTNRTLFGFGKPKVPATAADGTRNIDIEVYRWPGHGSPFTEKFNVDTADTPMVLDVLMKIKNKIDPTIAFRKSCREGICGSCAMNINGKNTLACLCTLDQAISSDGSIQISPLPHQHVVKDLITDMTRFYEHHKSVKPWLHLSEFGENSEMESIQTPKQRKLLDGLYECILCACCSTSCPSYWWHGQENYLGPAILLQAYRWLSDTRDCAFRERMAALASDHDKVFACHAIMNCTACCPKHLKPDAAIAQIKNLVLIHQSPTLAKFPMTSLVLFDSHHR